MMEYVVVASDAKCEVWQQIQINIKLMWNPRVEQQLTRMFTNNSELIKSKIVIITKMINIKLV
jgi:hypothetical protein